MSCEVRSWGSAHARCCCCQKRPQSRRFIKEKKKPNRWGFLPYITAIQDWVDAASRSLKASERFLGHLAVFNPTRTRSALFVKCFVLLCFLFLRDIDFIFGWKTDHNRASAWERTLASEPDFHLILKPGGGQESGKYFPSHSKDQTGLPLLRGSPSVSVHSPSPDQPCSIIFCLGAVTLWL